jgi:SRSO17 transposase
LRPLERPPAIVLINRGATGVDNDDFDKKFSLAKTLTNIRNTSNATTNSSNKQLLNSLLTTLNVAPAIVLIETTKAVLNSRIRAKFGLKDIRFMILNPKR